MFISSCYPLRFLMKEWWWPLNLCHVRVAVLYVYNAKLSGTDRITIVLVVGSCSSSGPTLICRLLWTLLLPFTFTASAPSPPQPVSLSLFFSAKYQSWEGLRRVPGPRQWVRKLPGLRRQDIGCRETKILESTIGRNPRRVVHHQQDLKIFWARGTSSKSPCFLSSSMPICNVHTVKNSSGIRHHQTLTLYLEGPQTRPELSLKAEMLCWLLWFFFPWILALWSEKKKILLLCLLLNHLTFVSDCSKAAAEAQPPPACAKAALSWVGWC